MRAQEKELQLPQVSVSAPRLSPEFQSIVKLNEDSIFVCAPSANALLNRVSSLYLKNYGPGNLASISLRGTGAQHTQVVWRGLPINHGMLGMCDVSLLSGSILNGAELAEGGSTTASVSGNFGGTLFLGNSEKILKNKFAVHSLIGSFGQFQNGFQGQTHWKSGGLAVNGWHSIVQNDFLIKNEGTWERQKNSQRRDKGLEISLQQNLKYGVKISSALWWQWVTREIPASLFQANSQASQSDISLRHSQILDWEWKRITFQLGYGFTRDFIRFLDPQIKIDAESQIDQHFAWHQTNWKIKKWVFQNQIWINSGNAHSPSYQMMARQNRLAFVQSAELQNIISGISIKILNRTENYDFSGKVAKGWSHQPGFQAYVENKKVGQIRFGLHKKWRLPTFNDLFWRPGGNPDLKPESGHAIEFSWNKYLISSELNSWNLEIKSYQTLIKNYIQWFPQGVFWQARNLGAVETHGLELANTLGKKVGKVKIEIQSSFHFCQARNLRPRFDGDEAEGKQLAYTPTWQSRNMLSFIIRGSKFFLAHQFSGERFADPVENQALEPLHLIDIGANGKLKTHQHFSVSGFAECQNLFNTQYQMVWGFPMPGRQFRLGIQFEIF